MKDYEQFQSQNIFLYPSCFPMEKLLKTPSMTEVFISNVKNFCNFDYDK